MTIDEIKELKVTHVFCLDDFIFFVRYFFKAQFKRKWAPWDHLLQIGDKLVQVLNGEITRLIINIAPRYGKTELAVKAFIAYGLALNPSAKFIHLSYSDSLALDNSRAAREMVSLDEYQKLFPKVKIQHGSNSTKKWYTTETGGVYATSTGGQITGFGAGQVDETEDEEIDPEFDQSLQELLEVSRISWLGEKAKFAGAIIIDDPNKVDDSDSELERNKVNNRYDGTISNRVNSRNTPIIIIQQRTHEDDLSGYLIRKQGVFGQKTEDGRDGIWHVLSLASIKVDGTALCPQKHTIEELLALQHHNEVVFQRQHMQNPTPTAGLLFPKAALSFYDHEEMLKFLGDPDFVYVPVDPANEGGDDFAAAPFVLIGDKIYVTEMLYNTDGTDFNEPAVVDMVRRNRVSYVGVESVFGWKETAQRIREELEEKGFEGDFRLLKPRQNKHARITNRASLIRNHFVFRKDYADFPQYKKFMANLTTYLKIQEPGKKNKHDDAPDLCEMAAGYFEKNFPHLFGMK